MTEALNTVYDAIDKEHSDRSAATRRRFVAGAAATLGGMGLMGLPSKALAANDAKTILDIAATAEVLATIVNTKGAQLVHLNRWTTRDNILDAAYQELDHYRVLTNALGAKPATRRIWVPDKVFSSAKNLLETLVAGDSIFVNAYLIGVTAFGNAGQGKNARYAAEIMGVEAVHRALALQSLNQPGNDLAFSQYKFTRIEDAVAMLKKAGFGFGTRGAGPGRFYDFGVVSKETRSRRGRVTSLNPA